MSKERLCVLDRVDVLDIDNLFDNRTIEEVLVDLQKLQSDYESMILDKGYDVKFKIDYDYNNNLNMSLHIYRDENDREYGARMKKEKAARARKRIAKEKKRERARKTLMKTEAQERAEYNRLRAKYECQTMITAEQNDNQIQALDEEQIN